MQSATEVREINLDSYIGDNGITADKITYELGDINCVQNLHKEDFTVAIGDAEFKVLNMVRDGDSLKLITEPFFFDGAGAFIDGKFRHYDFTVKCTDGALSFDKDKCKLRIKTVDGFVGGSYKASNGKELPYWLYMPDDTAPVPLMVWLHGGGEVLETSYKGANLTKNRGATCWIESGRKTAVLSVQFPGNYSFGISAKPDELKLMEEYNVVQYELIQGLISSGKIDAKRVYVSGASSGGGAVLRFIMQYPDFFAAALPICAKDTLIPISEPYGLAFKMQGSLEISDEAYEKCYKDISELMHRYNITDVPIWFVQAENDPVCTSYTSKIMYDVLKKMGAERNRITMYGNGEMKEKNAPFLHGSWIPAFNDKEIIDWIYAQSK